MNDVERAKAILGDAPYCFLYRVVGTPGWVFGMEYMLKDKVFTEACSDGVVILAPERYLTVREAIAAQEKLNGELR